MSADAGRVGGATNVESYNSDSAVRPESKVPVVKCLVARQTLWHLHPHPMVNSRR